MPVVPMRPRPYASVSQHDMLKFEERMMEDRLAYGGGDDIHAGVKAPEYLMAAATMDAYGLFKPDTSSLPKKELKVFDPFNTKVKGKDQSRVGQK